MTHANDPRAVSTAVIVLNYCGANDTMSCVESLCRLSQRIDVFVVDNASPDNSFQVLRTWGERTFAGAHGTCITSAFPDTFFAVIGEESAPPRSEDEERKTIYLMPAKLNGGYAAGNNIGLRAALRGEYQFFWVLNNDTEVHADALHWLLCRMGEDSRIGLCGSTLLYHSRRDMVQNYGGAAFRRWHGISAAIGMGEPFNPEVDRAFIERQMSYVNGASTLVSREFLTKIGLMEERYFLYWEEIDWAFRAANHFTLGFAPRSLVYHKVGASIGTNDFKEASPFVEYYFLRNRIFFCAMFSHRSLPYVVASVCRKFMDECARRSWQKAGAILRALVSGLGAAGAHYTGVDGHVRYPIS